MCNFHISLLSLLVLALILLHSKLDITTIKSQTVLLFYPTGCYNMVIIFIELKNLFIKKLFLLK